LDTAYLDNSTTDVPPCSKRYTHMYADHPEGRDWCLGAASKSGVAEAIGLLAKVDERAAQMGMSRAACMSLAIFRWLEREPRR
jgi:hypothetical protein